MLRKFVDINTVLSRRFDRLLPRHMLQEARADFRKNLVWRYVQPGMRVYDVGGGKRPFFSPAKKRELGLHVTGVDISGNELARAPTGSYDETIATDVMNLQGRGDADLVVCEMLLEHVPDTAAALRAIFSALKPGGRCVIAVPCTNSSFAQINRVLPQELKKKLLHGIFPSTKRVQGFPAYYDRCTPSAFCRASAASQLQLVELNRYYASPYFLFFFPAYVLWRLWTLAVVALRAGDLCETFTLVVQRPAQ